MTSSDNFVTIEMFNARMDRLEAIVEKNVALIQKENAEFRMQVQKDIATFKDEIRADMNNFKSEMHSGFDKVHGEIGVLQRDVEGLKHDVTGLYHWDYWLLSIILIVFVMPQFIMGIQSFFKALTEGVNSLRSAFKSKN